MDKQEEEEGTILIEEELVVVDLIPSHHIHNLMATMATIMDPSLTTIISHHNINYRIRKEYMLVLSARFVVKWDIWPLIAIIRWILYFKEKNPPTKLTTMAIASNTAIIGNSGPWLTDLEASDHITTNLNKLSVQSQYEGLDRIAVGNGQSLSINHIGNSTLSTKFHKFHLRNVLHVPRIASNLLSVHKICLYNNCLCYFDA